MDATLTALALEETFRFRCAKTVPCFNACCRDLNQFLTPYDILRLKNHLKMSSGDFLRRFCSQHSGPESGLPMVTLKPKGHHRSICPFVTSSGCHVYEHRPSSCRTYPLIRVVSKSRETGKITERFMIIRESHCLGFTTGAEQTISQWMQNQGLHIYNEMNDMLMEIISLKNRVMPGPLDYKSRRIFHLALYDLDNFRSQIFEKQYLNSFDGGKELLQAATADDVALLKLAIAWVKKELFHT